MRQTMLRQRLSRRVSSCGLSLLVLRSLRIRAPGFAVGLLPKPTLQTDRLVSKRSRQVSHRLDALNDQREAKCLDLPQALWSEVQTCFKEGRTNIGDQLCNQVEVGEYSVSYIIERDCPTFLSNDPREFAQSSAIRLLRLGDLQDDVRGRPGQDFIKRKAQGNRAHVHREWPAVAPSEVERSEIDVNNRTVSLGLVDPLLRIASGEAR